MLVARPESEWDAGDERGLAEDVDEDPLTFRFRADGVRVTLAADVGAGLIGVLNK